MQPPDNRKQCANCQHFILPDDQFCPYCGSAQPPAPAFSHPPTVISRPTEEKTDWISGRNPPVSTSEHSVPSNETTPHLVINGKIFRIPMRALIVVGIVCLVGGAWWLGSRNTSTSESTPGTIALSGDATPEQPTTNTPDTLASEEAAQMAQATHQAGETATAQALQATAQTLHATQTALALLERQAERETQIVVLNATAQSIQATQTAQAIAAAAAARTATTQAMQATNFALEQTAEALSQLQTAQAVNTHVNNSIISTNNLMRANQDTKVHSTPGLDTPTLTILEHGYDAEVLGDIRTVEDITWLKVRTVEDDVIGWVSNRSLRTITDMCVEGAFRKVQSIDLNMRSAPGRSADNVTKLSQGDGVELMGECEQVETSIWAKVRAGRYVGWVNTRFLE